MGRGESLFTVSGVSLSQSAALFKSFTTLIERPEKAHQS